MEKIGDTEESVALHRNIKRFQLHCLEYFNEAYHTVDEYVWLPLLAKDEMHKDELFLATVDILSQFGMIDSSSGKAETMAMATAKATATATGTAVRRMTATETMTTATAT